jgi:hypothetical protein
MRRAITLATLLAFGSAFAAPAARAEDYLGTDFEAFTGIAPPQAQTLSDEEMNELRGGFLGFLFSVNLVGSVEMGGVADVNLDVNVQFNDETGELSFPLPDDPALVGGSVSPSVLVTDPSTDQAFQVTSRIGDAFSGARGVFQISQIPGNLNDISQVLVINLAIINAGDASFSMVQDQLGSLFGL